MTQYNMIILINLEHLFVLNNSTSIELILTKLRINTSIRIEYMSKPKDFIIYNITLTVISLISLSNFKQF